MCVSCVCVCYVYVSTCVCDCVEYVRCVCVVSAGCAQWAVMLSLVVFW
jgi:hypothetical protein